MKVYFKQQFKVTYKPGDYGTFVEKTINKINYGDKTLTMSEITGKAGYEFVGWDKEIENTVTKDMVYTAIWQAKDDIKYEVYHYKVVSDGYELVKHEVLNGTTDSFISVLPIDINGYRYDKDYHNDGMVSKDSRCIIGDGSLVLKLFYVVDEISLTYKANSGNGNDVVQTGLVN